MQATEARHFRKVFLNLEKKALIPSHSSHWELCSFSLRFTFRMCKLCVRVTVCMQEQVPAETTGEQLAPGAVQPSISTLTSRHIHP